MAETFGKALYHPSVSYEGIGPIRYDRHESTDDQLVSTAYPTLALFVDGGKIGGLRSPAAAPVWKEWLLGGSLPRTGYKLSDEADRWTKEVLTQARQQLTSGEYGVFTPAFKRFQATAGNGDGISLSRYFADSPIANPFSEGLWFVTAFQEFAKAIKKGVLSNTEFNVKLGSGNDVVLPGWQANSETHTGAGDDIFLSSPQVHIAQLYDKNRDPETLGADPTDWNSYAYFPTPYEPKKLKGEKDEWYKEPIDPSQPRPPRRNSRGNIVHAGPGEDLIYYDSGIDQAHGGLGNDVMAPSFAGMNWSVDTIIQGEDAGLDPTSGKQRFDYSAPQLNLWQDQSNPKQAGRTWVRGAKALLNPMRAIRRGQQADMQQHVYDNVDYGLDGYQFDARKRELEETEHRIKIRVSDHGEGPGFGYTKKDDVWVIDRNEINIVGGSDLYGGPGTDTFYGIDPSFFKGYETAAPVAGINPEDPETDMQGLRVAFDYKNEKQTSPDPDASDVARKTPQLVKTTRMFGGHGADLFELGNPGNVFPQGSDTELEGDKLYRISGNHDGFLRKDTTSFGAEASPDMFSVNLAYAGESWRRPLNKAPGEGGAADQPTLGELAELGLSGVEAASGVLEAFEISLPIFSAVTGLASFALGIASLFKTPPVEPIPEEEIYYKDPVGSWRQSIWIQDHDPLDSIRIRVDPSNPLSDAENRWKNIYFQTTDVDDSNENQSILINFQNAQGQEHELFRLEETLKSSKAGGWFGWNFQTGALEQIGEKNFSFFGQVGLKKEEGYDPKADPDLGSYLDAYRFDVKDGQTVFRWTDSTLINNEQRLDSMRSRSENIVYQFDSMSHGYYWDIQYKASLSDNPNPAEQSLTGLTIDEDETKLWIRNVNPAGEITWKDYTYRQTKNDVDAQDAAAKTKPKWIFDGLSGTPSSEGLYTNFAALGQEMNGGLDGLIRAANNSGSPLTQSRGQRLKSESWQLDNLYKVTDIVTMGGQENAYTIVYHTPEKNRPRFAILKTVIDSNTAYPAYGLTKQELMREEKVFGRDLDENGLIGRMASTSAAG